MLATGSSVTDPPVQSKPSHGMLTIFDCDGVLVDSELVALRVLVEMMAGFGHTMSLAECRDAFMGMHNDDIVRGIEQRIGRALPGESQRMRARMLARLERELRPVPGVVETLARLDGPRCVASSSDRERIGLTLRWTGLDRFFGDRIFSGLDVPRGKPAPDLFLRAAATMGIAPQDCVVVEDSVMGVVAGRAARMRVIGFTGGSHSDPGHAERLRAAGAEVVISHMRDLDGLLADIEVPVA